MRSSRFGTLKAGTAISLDIPLDLVVYDGFLHDDLVSALRTLNRKRPHAVLAHVGEVHRLDRVVEA